MTASRPFCDRDVQDGTVAYNTPRGREAQINNAEYVNSGISADDRTLQEFREIFVTIIV
jgi:hypothetical protein